VGPQLVAAGSTLIRTHDSGVLDWCVLFPDPTRDPLDPTAYDWAAGDAYFASIVSAGFRAYLRLGTSWSVPSPACISPDPDVFAAVAVQTLRRYNELRPAAWPAGQVAYVELWNEPDGARFWNGTAAAFYELFDTTARALKAFDAGLRVGGPGVGGPLQSSAVNFSFGLLDFVAARGTPIDFFSWHSYGDIAAAPAAWGHSPTGIYNATIAAVRAALRARNLSARVSQHVTEWQPVILGRGNVTGSAEAASFTASALSLMAAARDVQVSVFYPACEGTGSDGSWGMFLDWGNGTLGWRREGRAWAAVGGLLRDAPNALDARVAPAQPADDFVVLAGASDAGDEQSIVVSSRTPAAGGAASFALTTHFAGACASQSARVAVFMLNDRVDKDGEWTNTTVDTIGCVVNTTIAGFFPPAVARVIISKP
jgi:hypothetical protein